MLVNLEKNWFGPDASLHQVSGNPHDFPDDWEDQLPKGAKEVEPPKSTPKPAAEKK
jgi:hypothetical protein